jgi:glutathione S-transferase
VIDARALVRLQADYISRDIVPAWYRYLQSQEPETQIEHGKAYLQALQKLFALFIRAEEEGELGAVGLWREGGELNFADIMVAPWLYRSVNILKHYRGFELPSEGRTAAYFKRVVEHEAFKKTCSEDAYYIASYAR